MASSFQYDVVEPVRFNTDAINVRALFSPNTLSPGTYTLSVGSFGRQNEIYDWVENVAKFEIRHHFASGKPYDHRLGITTVKVSWIIL